MPWKASHLAIFAGLLVSLLVAFLLLLALGSVKIPWWEVAQILGGSPATHPIWERIIWDLRLPKAFTALLAGLALGLSGLQMQTLFRNPLADAFVLGISAGASLGVALVVLMSGKHGGFLLNLTWGLHLGVVSSAISGAGLVLVLVMLVARRIENHVTLLILGLMFSAAVNGLVSVLVYFSQPEEIQAYLMWTFGSFRNVTWRQLAVFAPAIGLGWLLMLASLKSLNALLLGSHYAASMGIGVTSARYKIMLSTAILSGAVTAFCGPIGFLGIIVPHLCRSLLQTSDHRLLLPAVSLMGALIAVTSELLTQWPSSEQTLPLNAITSLLGAPVVIWILWKRAGGPAG